MCKKICILYDNKVCNHCGECEMCDLDPSKVCDNCEKCLHIDDNYNVLEMDMLAEYDDETVLDDPEVYRQISESEEDWLSDFYNHSSGHEYDDYDKIDQYHDYDDYDKIDQYHDYDEDLYNDHSNFFDYPDDEY